MSKEKGSRMQNRRILRILFASFIITSGIIIINISSSIPGADKENDYISPSPDIEKLDISLKDSEDNNVKNEDETKEDGESENDNLKRKG